MNMNIYIYIYIGFIRGLLGLCRVHKEFTRVI